MNIVSVMHSGILDSHYTIMQWIWVGVNISCIDTYAVVKWANDIKSWFYVTL